MGIARRLLRLRASLRTACIWRKDRHMQQGTLAVDGGRPAIPSPLPYWTDVKRAGQEEIDAVSAVIRRGKFFRFEGSECEGFEADARAWLGARHALFVNSGTSALICALAGLEIGPGDEVIVPAYTYIATAASVLAVGAVPVLAEIDESLGLDPNDVRAKITPHTRAIIPVHMQGVPCRLGAIRQIAAEHGLKVLEDSCQAVGSSYHGAKTGVESDAGVWSLNYYKIITCGEGGLFFTNNPDIFERALFQHDPAMPMWLKERQTWSSEPFSRECYRGNEIMAAMARVQLRKLPAILDNCRRLKRQLIDLLDAAPCNYRVQHVDDPEGDCGISFAMIAKSQETADRMAKALSAEGLPIGSVYNQGFPDRHIYACWDSILGKHGATEAGYPWKDPRYKGCVEYHKDGCPRTLNLLSRCLRIVIHRGLEPEHISLIASAINKVDRGIR